MATPTCPEVLIASGSTAPPDFSHGTGGFRENCIETSFRSRSTSSGQGYHDRRGRARLILRAKTGWQARVEPQIGWWVGWVETLTGAVIFALNIDLPGGMKDAPKREAIVRSILQSIGALPR